MSKKDQKRELTVQQIKDSYKEKHDRNIEYYQYFRDCSHFSKGTQGPVVEGQDPRDIVDELKGRALCASMLPVAKQEAEAAKRKYDGVLSLFHQSEQAADAVLRHTTEQFSQTTPLHGEWRNHTQVPTDSKNSYAGCAVKFFKIPRSEANTAKAFNAALKKQGLTSQIRGMGKDDLAVVVNLSDSTPDRLAASSSAPSPSSSNSSSSTG